MKARNGKRRRMRRVSDNLRRAKNRKGNSKGSEERQEIEGEGEEYEESEQRLTKNC